MDGKTSHTKTTLLGSIELITKLGTVTVVILYVLGLLVTNAHLMRLGIADFSALQARFVFSGVLFLIYVLLLVGGPVVFALVLWAAYMFPLKKMPPRWRLGAMLLVFGPLSAWLVVSLYASYLGYLYPWGQSYESQFASAISPRAYFRTIRQSVQMMEEAFFHAKTLMGGLALLSCVPFLYVGITRRANPKAKLIAIGSFPLGLAAMALILFGYAQRVFPNLPYNLGGGQPRVVQLYVREADSSLLSANGLVMEVRPGGPVVSVPLALWHQDTSFLYVTPVSTPDSGTARITAIRSDAVEVVAYLGGYVKVTSEGKIQDAHVDMPRKP